MDDLAHEKRFRLLEKLARCQELAREYRDGQIAAMLRDMEEEINSNLRLDQRPASRGTA
jgi:hypothetical protein